MIIREKEKEREREICYSFYLKLTKGKETKLCQLIIHQIRCLTGSKK
jgi:hypothetical protein